VNTSKKFYAFKYKLSILLFTVVLLVSSFLGIFQYIIMGNTLKASFEQNKELIKDRVINIVRDADYINLLIEEPLEIEAKELLSKVKEAYETSGTIEFNLEPFLEGKEDIHLYIIDDKNKIVSSTNQKDLGLNFSPWIEFTKYLEVVRKNKVFSRARMTLSITEGEMTKFCYMPSSDGKYIFETGELVKQKDLLTKGIGFDNFEERVMIDSPFVDSIILFDYKGTAYKRDETGKNIEIDEAHRQYFDRAIQTMETVEVTERYDGKKVYYQYVPYQIIGAQGAHERNVIEIIYNDTILSENLNDNIKMILIVVSVGAVLAASFGFYQARIITKPIEAITEGVKQVSEGQFNIKVKVDTNDEFSLLAVQFSKMTKDIEMFIEERYKTQEALEKKNREIVEQKEEIEALYEETTSMNDELEILLKRNRSSYFETVRALANAVEEKDAYTGGHCERVMQYSMLIAEAMGLSEGEKEDLKFGSILHDIGKIGIPENILNKSGALSCQEYNLIEKHPEIGNRILKDLNFLENCRRTVFEHHERVDGKGYPRGLEGNQIYLLAKIVCIADAFDAMTSIRPYRQEAMSKEEAIQELILHKNQQFDENIVDIFVKQLMENEIRPL
jgi:putative nucleotidyltransferase with HDIG domain